MPVRLSIRMYEDEDEEDKDEEDEDEADEEDEEDHDDDDDVFAVASNGRSCTPAM